MGITYICRCPGRPEKGVKIPGAGVIGSVSCLPLVCLLNSHPLSEQQALLTTEASL